MYPEILSCDDVLGELISLASLTSDNTYYADRSTRNNFYQSQPWRVKRAAILERDHHECVVCKSLGLVTLDQLIVHHIKVLEYFPDYRFIDSNLITVCQMHHNRIHGLIAKRWNDEWW